MSTLTKAQVYRRAASVIGFRGWNQGSYYDAHAYAAGTPIDDCAVCLVGAVNVAVKGAPDDSVGAQPFIDFLGEVLEGRVGHPVVSFWNDDDGRTVDEVLELLEVAALRAEAVAS